MGVNTCEACGCPSDAHRTSCAWCDSPIAAATPVAFVIESTEDRYEWFSEGTMVASAMTIHGLWQILDARGHHVVTLMPLSSGGIDDRPAMALVGPTARMLGTIHRDDEERGRSDTATTRDDSGQTVLVMRGNGPTGSYIVDRHGEIVAVSSWDEQESTTDLLVTSSGTRQSLAMVFGLVLANALDRQTPHRLA